MGETLNIANAILIIGMLYFGYTYGFHLGHFLLIIFSLAFWAYHGFNDERKAFLVAKTQLLRAKADYYDRQYRKGSGDK